MALQIGSTNPWMTSAYADSPLGTGAGRTTTPSSGVEGSPDGKGAKSPDRTLRGVVAEAARSGNTDPSKMPPEEQAQLEELKHRDQEVRQHEAAHMAVGGAYVRGGASYTYQPGPDGRRYAVGGEVSVDTSSVSNNPEATIAKMQVVRRAALAPANPSGQDLSVAARAAQAEMQARMQAQEQVRSSVESATGSPDSTESAVIDQAPSSPADTVGPVPATSGALVDRYA